MEKVLGSIDFSKLLDPEKIIGSMLPIEVTVKLKLYKSTDESYVLQVIPVEKAKK